MAEHTPGPWYTEDNRAVQLRAAIASATGEQ